MYGTVYRYTAKVPRNIRAVTRRDESSKFAQRVLMYMGIYVRTILHKNIQCIYNIAVSIHFSHHNAYIN